MKTIEDAWNGYRLAVVPATASPVQISETRQAFYAGHQSMLGLLAEVAGSSSEDIGVSRMSLLQLEIMDFVSNL